MNKPEKLSQHQLAPVSWRDSLPIHPAADLFPLMNKDELRELADDIEKHGLRELVAFQHDAKTGKDVLLDGRNRFDALALLGRDPLRDVTVARVRDDLDPYAYVISKNVHRRHLTAEQRRELIAKVLKAKPETSNLQIAKQVKADDKTVAKVRAELESTSDIPKLIKTVGKDGKSRPARKPKGKASKAKAEQKTFDSPQEAHASKAAPKPISKQEIRELLASWLEVSAHIRAGNRTRLKDALEIHREKIDRILESLSA